MLVSHNAESLHDMARQKEADTTSKLHGRDNSRISWNVCVGLGWIWDNRLGHFARSEGNGVENFWFD
jgi:hypothetical protein